MAEPVGEPNRRKLLKLMGATAAGAVAVPAGAARPAQPRLVGRSVPFIRKDGLLFKDHSKDGRLHPYEDWRLPAEVRARDLVGRMTLAEKAGTMVHPIAGAGTSYFLDEVPAGYPAVFQPVRPMITDRHVTTLLSMFSTRTSVLVSQNNTLQEIAEGGRLGIPLTLSTDPRNGFAALGGQSSPAGDFTRWPGTLGFAAIGDRDLVREFADTARQEYRAAGFSVALSPQADIAAEPRWTRINGTFGEDVDVVTDLTAQYIRGFQHGSGGIGPRSVVCVVKHFAGHGAQVNGYDSHFLYGKYAAFSGHGFPAHVEPFRAAVHEAGVGSVMTMYSIAQDVTLFGRPLEQVGAAFNRQLVTELLRRDIGFDGVVLTDWQVTDAPPTDPEDPVSGKPWGVEDLTEKERFVKAIDAGVDQFGGTSSTDRIVEAVEDGSVTERRIDASVFRILLQKFRQGLFEAPYADPEFAERTVGNATFKAAARRAQHRSVVLLQNRDGILPLGIRGGSGTKVYGYGLSAAALTAYGMTAVADPAQADLAVLLLQTPRSGEHRADLDYKEANADYQAVLAVHTAGIPSVAAVQLDRPAILTNIRDKVTGLVAHFGLSEEALLDVLTGRARPEGRLPFDLPSTPESVLAQRPDLPYDLRRPLYRRGFGLTYPPHRSSGR